MNRTRYAARLVRLVLLITMPISLLGGCSTPVATPTGETSDTATAPTEKAFVSVTFDFGDGRRKAFDAVSWRQGITVIEAVVQASQASDGLSVEHRGSGERAFLESVDGVKNTGAGKNWIFKVNGTKSEVGSGSYQLNAGDRVLWEYTDVR